MSTPNKVDTLETWKLRETLCALESFPHLEKLDKAINEVFSQGYRFFATKQRRGYCNYTDKIITIPLWAINSTREGYFLYYLAHEVAHAYSSRMDHGPVFMKAFIAICPKEYQHYELEYKPRNAQAAGIMGKDF